MASIPARGPLTDFMVDQLRAGELLVGKALAPDEGGWDDDPEAVGSTFYGYIVVTPSTAQEGSGSLADAGIEWALPYVLASYGIDLTSVEGQADTARKIVSEIKRVHVDLDGVGWKVIDIKVNSIGGVDVDRTAKPNELSQKDVVIVRISKEL